LYVGAWSSNLDGEQYYDDQEYYFEPDQQDQQESFDQGKYNMGPSFIYVADFFNPPTLKSVWLTSKVGLIDPL
jgi:hypothetical protein